MYGVSWDPACTGSAGTRRVRGQPGPAPSVHGISRDHLLVHLVPACVGSARTYSKLHALVLALAVCVNRQVCVQHQERSPLSRPGVTYLSPSLSLVACGDPASKASKCIRERSQRRKSHLCAVGTKENFGQFGLSLAVHHLPVYLRPECVCMCMYEYPFEACRAPKGTAPHSTRSVSSCMSSDGQLLDKKTCMQRSMEGPLRSARWGIRRGYSLLLTVPYSLHEE